MLERRGSACLVILFLSLYLTNGEGLYAIA